MNILGVHCPFNIDNHDPAAALICDGELVAVCEEERFLRIKLAKGCFPVKSIQACLKEAGLKISDIDLVVSTGETAGKDLLNRIELSLEHHFGSSPQVILINHQKAHIYSAFYYSGYDSAMCLSYDAWGDRLSAAYATGSEKGIKMIGEEAVDNSLGIFYAVMTTFLGYYPGLDEFKVMGLASYGKEGVDLSDFAKPVQGGYQINKKYWRTAFPWKSSFEPYYSSELVRLLGKPRVKGEKITQRHKDIAYATQKAMESCAVSLVTALHEKTGETALCMAGGLALNCSANYCIHQLEFIERLFVQPAATDRGLALGCAIFGAVQQNCLKKLPSHVYFGPTYSDEDIIHALTLTGTAYEYIEKPAQKCAQLLAQGKIVAFFQGRSEFGPRALGNRSILADPRSASMKDEINNKVKFRETFRPFAPAVAVDRAQELFRDIHEPSPFMTVTFPIKEKWVEQLQAVSHIDHTGRVQTVSESDNPIFYQTIKEFEKLTGVPVVLNTSFNIKGEPIVESPFNAISTFSGTGMDAMVIGNYLVKKVRAPRV